MNFILSTAGGIFCLLIPATLLASGWNVLPPDSWCWLERGHGRHGRSHRHRLLFLFIRSYTEEKLTEYP